MPGHGVTFRPLDFIFLLESATYLCLKNGKILPAAIICAYFMFRSALYIVSSQSNVMLRKTLILKLKSLYCKIDRYALKETQPKNSSDVMQQLPLLSFSALMRTWPGGLWLFYSVKVFRTR